MEVCTKYLLQKSYKFKLLEPNLVTQAIFKRIFVELLCFKNLLVTVVIMHFVKLPYIKNLTDFYKNLNMKMGINGS